MKLKDLVTNRELSEKLRDLAGALRKYFSQAICNSAEKGELT